MTILVRLLLSSIFSLRCKIKLFKHLSLYLRYITSANQIDNKTAKDL